MTAAANHSSDRTGCLQQWRRTVFVRQGRFFIISVTVRSKCDLPLRTAFPRTYTAGRFTVREELQWSQVASQKAENHSSVPIHVVYRRQHICSSWKCTDTGLTGVSSQEQQQHCSEHSADTPTTQSQQQQQQQQEQQEQQEGQAHSLQAASPAPLIVVGSSWWKRLLFARSAAGIAAAPQPSAAAAGPLLDERASVSCLRLGSSWGLSLRKALSSVARGLKRAAGLQPAAMPSAGHSLTTRGGQQDAKRAAGSTAEVVVDASAASGSRLCTKAGLAAAKPSAVLVTVLGYSWGGEAVSTDAPA